MPKIAKTLTALAVTKMNRPGVHAVGGVDGLALQVSPSGTKSWVLRYSVGNKRRALGLGSFRRIDLATARERGRKARDLLESDVDPIEQKRARRSAARVTAARAITFKTCGVEYFAQHEGSLSPKHAKQWTSTLQTYVYPIIGDVAVADVNTALVMKVLEPIWSEQTQNAKRLRGRIEAVLDWAKVAEYRAGDNPARWRGHLDKLLARPSKIAKTNPHEALPISEVGGFVKQLRKSGGAGAGALEFLILTAARSEEVRFAVWSEISPDYKVWTIPAERMKARKEHRVPLSEPAIKLLKSMPRTGTRIFPELPENGMRNAMKQLRDDIKVHGFRSTFRDWAGETTAYPREVIEHALAHQLKDKAEAAYARGTAFEKRRLLMADWAKFCALTDAASVISMMQFAKTAAN